MTTRVSKNLINDSERGVLYEFAAAIFDGTSGSVTVESGITSVTRNSTGLYTIVFDTIQPDVNYFIDGFGESALRGNVMFVLANKTTSQCQIRTSDSSTGGVGDFSEVHVKFSRLRT